MAILHFFGKVTHANWVILESQFENWDYIADITNGSVGFCNNYYAVGSYLQSNWGRHDGRESYPVIGVLVRHSQNSVHSPPPPLPAEKIQET